MSKFKRKTNWKRIVCAVLVTVLVVSLGGALISFAVKDTRTIPSSAFKVGGLDENGKYVADGKSIYTKKAFECIGLRVQPDFENQLTYDVYYYDYDERLVEVKKGLTDVYDEDYPLAQYCRIVIHPEFPEESVGNKKDTETKWYEKIFKKNEDKIKWYEVDKYADNFKITVDRKQEYLYKNSVNLYNEENVSEDKGFNATVGDKLTITEVKGAKCSERISLDPSWEFIDLYIRNVNNTNVNSQAIVITDEDDTVLVSKMITAESIEYSKGEWARITIEIPSDSGALSLYVRMYEEVECYIFGY